MERNPVIDEMGKRWSAPSVTRDQRVLDQFSGGLLNARTLANLDSQGQGPPDRFRVGKKICYPVDGLVEWMQKRLHSNLKM